VGASGSVREFGHRSTAGRGVTGVERVAVTIRDFSNLEVVRIYFLMTQ